jgi:hypothetical protein
MGIFDEVYKAPTEPLAFNPRTEISADARHIARRVVINLWIIFVALPLALALLYVALK